MINEHYYNRYQRFIESRKLRTLSNDVYTEKHHIIPISLGGLDIPENIIVLSGREHYIAHWILAKAYQESMIYAFWMMNTDKRMKYSRYSNSYGYEIAKKMLAKQVSDNMKGFVTCFDKHLSKNVHISVFDFYKNRERYEHVSEGKALYVTQDGIRLILKTNDELVLSGKVKHYRVGYKHSKQTIIKMSENSGIKNKILISNEDTGESRYINSDSDIPEGFSKGMLSVYKQHLSALRKDLYQKKRWVTNGIDNLRIFIYNDSDIPEGYHLGRTLKTKVCPYCGITIDVGNYSKHHGEKCKQKENNNV